MRFEFHSADRGFRKGLLFLSGRGKSIQSWNVTSTGKVIDLEKGFRERAQTCLVEFDESDLTAFWRLKNDGVREEDQTLSPLIAELDPKVQWLVVGSSLGGYFASLLPQTLLSGLILIDSVTALVRTDFRVPVRVHLAIDNERIPDFPFWERVTAYHSRSAVIVHWDHPGKIRESLLLGLSK